MYEINQRISREYSLILNTPPQVGAYKSYALSLLHMYLIGEGPPEKVHRRGSNEEGSDGEGPKEKIRLRRFD